MTSNTSTAIASPRFADFFDSPLPRGVREIAADMSWDDVAAHFGAPAHTGAIQLDNWECADVRRPGAPAGAQARDYRASITVGGRTATATSSATGPLSALTAMLYERGAALEMLRFHQLQSGGHTATFIHGSNGARAQWAIGWSDCANESALRAVVACANRLSAPANG